MPILHGANGSPFVRKVLVLCAEKSISFDHDPLIPFAGGPITLPSKADRGSVLSAGETLARYALRNRCGAWEEIAITDHFPNDGTRVRLHAYRGCAQPLFQYIIDGGGHTWPGNKNHRWVEVMILE